MNYFESNPCYDSNYSSFEQIEPPQYSVNPSLNIQNKLSHRELFINELIQQKLQNEYAQPFSSIAITFDLPTMEPEDHLRIGDEHLDTIPKTESNEFIKSSVENLIPDPSESEDLSDNEDIISGLWPQLQQHTVVLRILVSHSNLMQPRTALPYQAHLYSVSLHKGTALPEDRFKYLVRRIGMRCLTPAELEVLTKESA
nr:hypothetical protein [Tanacetum cinerariifolium]